MFAHMAIVSIGVWDWSDMGLPVSNQLLSGSSPILRKRSQAEVAVQAQAAEV